MKLQVAMDLLTVEDALELAGKVAEYVDIIELGTPLIKAAGLSAVTAVKAAHPDKIVFADMKTMDAGELEADIAFKAGADLVTVLGAADDSTIAGAVKAAKAHNKGIVVDLIGVADKVTRAKEVRALGAKFVFVGRPFNYAAAVAGEAGVRKAITLLREEVSRNMAMLGVNSLAELDASYLLRTPSGV